MSDVTTSKASISVVIPAFEAESTIARAIESVYAQDYEPLELIVVDDASADGTGRKVLAAERRAGDIQLVRLDSNRGVSAARNEGIRRASGEYLAFLDADDLWLPGKLDRQTRELDADSEVVLVTCDSLKVSAGGTPLKRGHVNRPPVAGGEAWKTLLRYNFLPTPTVMTRCRLVKELGGFDSKLPVAEDLDLWIRLALLGKIAIVEEVMVHYFDVPGSLMKSHLQESQDLVRGLVERYLEAEEVRLTAGEIRRTRGHRAFEFACERFFNGFYLESLSEFLRSARLGHRPLTSLSYLPRAVVNSVLADRSAATSTHPRTDSLEGRNRT